jgi:hypothetical protein
VLLALRKRHSLLAAVFALVHGAVAVAAPPASTSPAVSAPLPPAPHLQAVRVATAPVLDGKLDDPAWKLAPAAEGFTQKLPTDGAPPSDPTTVRVVYDDDAVYVAFDCPQAHTQVVERLTRRDRQVEVDAVWFDLGTRGDHKSAFEFYVNASGTLADAIRFHDTDYSPDWDENWEARTNVTAEGWTAEFRIPLRALRFPTLPVQSWDFQATRYISLRQEQDDWAYFPRSVAGEVSHYGRLDGLEGLRERTAFELRPFVVGRLRRRDPASGQLASGTDFRPSVGLDVKWHPTQDLTLDATVNPDFAQVEADQVVLNLSTVETYYPEKRPFFLEGIDAFSTPFQLLYTRRIGRVPPIPSLRLDAVNNEQLVDVPEPATIYGATKLSGRIGDKWSVGTVQAVTAQNSVDVQLANGARVTRTVDPTSAFNVLRLKRDLGDNAHVGFMGTAVTHAESTGDYPLLAPTAGASGATALCPNPTLLTPRVQQTLEVAPLGRCFNNAYTGAFDWRWRSPSGDYATGGQFVSSVLEKGPDRPVADGTVVRPGDVGWGVQAFVDKEGGKHWTGGVGTDVESRKLDITDLGYNQRANQYTGWANAEYRELDRWGPFLEAHAGAFFATTYNADGLLVGQGLHLEQRGKFKNLWTFNNDLSYRGTKYDDREVGDGTALQRVGRFGDEFFIGTDTTKRVSIGGGQITEIIYDGFNMKGNATLSLRVLPQFDVDVLPTWQWTFGEPRFLFGGATANQYLFGELDAKSLGVTLRTTYTFTPRLTLQGYAQLFLASGHYSHFTQYQANGPKEVVRLGNLTPFAGALPYNPDFEQGVLNVNAVLRWEYRLGSILYLVYTHSQVPATVLDPNAVGGLNLAAVNRAPASDVILAKLSFWWGG